MITGCTSLIADNFIEIKSDGVKSKTITSSTAEISYYQAHQLSSEVYMLTYKTDSCTVTSIWQQNDGWYCVHRQLTENMV